MVKYFGRRKLREMAKYLILEVVTSHQLEFAYITRVFKHD